MIEQQDRRAERKKQEERGRAVVAARKRIREEQLRQLHLLASEVAALIGGTARAPVAGNAWMFVDLSESHELSFYREGDQINIRGRVDGERYALNVSPRASPNIVKAINKTGSCLDGSDSPSPPGSNWRQTPPQEAQNRRAPSSNVCVASSDCQLRRRPPRNL